MGPVLCFGTSLPQIRMHQSVEFASASGDYGAGSSLHDPELTCERCLIVEWPYSATYGMTAVMPSPYATNKANLIEMLTYCRARA
jgi:hypothetical protein